jgi:hypothetical protein
MFLLKINTSEVSPEYISTFAFKAHLIFDDVSNDVGAIQIVDKELAVFAILFAMVFANLSSAVLFK